MSTSSLIGIIIGCCFVVFGILIRLFPINSNWFFPLYTTKERMDANRYISIALLLFGAGFCIAASLPMITGFRGLRAETFVVLAILTLNISWRVARKYVQATKQKLKPGNTGASDR